MVNQDLNIGELIPEISPNVEDKLIICLAKEVQLYTKSMKGTKCLLCPFRVLSRFSYLRRHLQYHCRENMFVASLRSSQLNVIRAIFNRRLAITPVSIGENLKPDLLRLSAAFIQN